MPDLTSNFDFAVEVRMVHLMSSLTLPLFQKVMGRRARWVIYPVMLVKPDSEVEGDVRMIPLVWKVVVVDRYRRCIRTRCRKEYSLVDRSMYRN